MLSWLPPPNASHNGVIKMYKLHVVQIETKDSIDMTSSSTKMTLKNLHPYYHYQISVAAVTVDVGPYATITVQTLEDGMHLYVCVCVCMCVTCSYTPLSSKWTTSRTYNFISDFY